MIAVLCCTGIADSGIMPPMKYWEIVADKLSAAGWSWGYCSAVTPDGWRWIVDAHRQRRGYVLHSDELLTAFLELNAIRLRPSAPSLRWATIPTGAKARLF